MTGLLSAPTPALRALREKLNSGAAWPPTSSMLKKVPLLADEVAPLIAAAPTREHAIAVLDIVLHERRARQRDVDSVELVWSGPEQGTTETRETAVVLRELFLAARRSVLVATFVCYDGDSVFKDLAERHDAGGLDVRFLLHANDDPDGAAARRRCVDEFRHNWPGKLLPALWIDPRTTAPAQKRTTMHAKFVAVDDEVVFLTSANFTEAAQERNVEAGVLIRQPSFAARLRRHVDGLVDHGLLERVG